MTVLSKKPQSDLQVTFLLPTFMVLNFWIYREKHFLPQTSECDREREMDLLAN